MKIFLGFTEIAGYYTNLQKGFDELGVESLFVNLTEHPFQYGNWNTTNLLVNLTRRLIKMRASIPQSNWILQALLQRLQTISQVLLLCWALMKYDVFIFGFLSSFLFFYDLPILKLFGKRIIYVFHGSDSRLPYIDGFINRNLGIVEIVELTRKRKKQIQKIERYADFIVNTPLSSHLHEKPVLFFQMFGVPFKGDNIDSAKAETSPKIRILHSPSDPEGKGTPRIRQAIQNLQTTGYMIEFIEIVGKPNTVVLHELARCDLIIDQLYSDVPMAGFAAEAAFFGKPAIVGGYAQAEIQRIFPPDMLPPTHYCHPDDIEQAIEKLIVDEQYRVELGQRAKQFVESHWTIQHVAECYLRVIEGNICDWWLYDPRDIRYLWGAGLPKQRAKQLVRAVIEQGGTQALQLSDKPELERLLLEFSTSV